MIMIIVHLFIVQASRRDLLAIDFEGVLKYFRVQLPKKYKSEEAAKELLQIAVSMKVRNTVCYFLTTEMFVFCVT